MDIYRVTHADNQRHIYDCNHAFCPCYLAGVQDGVKPLGRTLLESLRQRATTSRLLRIDSVLQKFAYPQPPWEKKRS